jgi:hypothetical protein
MACDQGVELLHAHAAGQAQSPCAGARPLAGRLATAGVVVVLAVRDLALVVLVLALGDLAD